MPDLSKTITIVFRGDTVKFNDAIYSINKALRSLGNDITELNKSIKLDPNNAQIYADKLSALNERIKLGKQALKEYQEQLDPLQEKLKNGEALTDKELKQYLDLQNHIAETTRQVDSYNKTLEETQYIYDNLFKYNLSAAFYDIGSGLDKLSTKLKGMADTFKPISAFATTILSAATKQAIGFEDAMSDVRKVMKDSDFNAGYFETLRDNILDMSKRIPTTAIDIAKVVANSLQLGVAAKDADKFAETMIKLGTSTNINADEASIAIAQFYNIMKGDLSTVDRFGAALVDLGNNFPTFESDIMNMATRLASTGKTMKLSEQQVLGLATALTSVGLSAENGGSAISTIFQNISKVIASNTKADKAKLAAFADLLGMTSKKFKEAWNADAFVTFQKIVAALGEASAEGKNVNAILSEMGIKNIRQVDSMLRLANAGDVFTKALKTANTAWAENSALNDEASRKYQTLQSQLTMTWNNLKALGIEIGEMITPYLSQLLEFVNKLIDKFRELPESTKKAAVFGTILTAAISPLLKGLSGLTGGFGDFFRFLGELTGKRDPGKLATGIKKFGDAISSALGGKVFNLNFGGFSGFSKLGTLISTFFSKVKDALYSLPMQIMNGTLFDGLKTAISSFYGTLVGFKDKGFGFLKRGGERLGSFAINLVEGISNIVLHPLQTLDKIFSGIGNLFVKLANGITVGGVLAALAALALSFKVAYDNSEVMRSTVKGFIDLVKYNFLSAFSKVKETVSGFIGYVKDKAQPIIEQIHSVIQEKIVPILVDMWTTILPILETILHNVFNAIASIVEWLVDKLKPVIDIIVKAIQVLVIPAITLVIQVLAKVVKGIVEVFHWLWEILQPILKPIADILNDVFTFAWDLLLGVINFLIDAFQWLIDKLSELWGWLKDVGVIDAFKTAFDGVRTIIEDVVTALGNALQAAKKFLDKIVEIDKKKINVSTIGGSSGAAGAASSLNRTQNNNITINTQSSHITNSDMAVVNRALGSQLFGF